MNGVISDGRPQHPGRYHEVSSSQIDAELSLTLHITTAAEQAK